MQPNNKCCSVEPTKQRKKGFWSGFVYGLIPHSFCIAFALFSIFGAITITTLFKKILLIPNIFIYLIIISFLFATLSVILYLKKKECLCIDGIKNNLKYISTIYSTTLIINMLFFYWVIPILVNATAGSIENNNSDISKIVLNVDIPCSGHAFLITQEVHKDAGVKNIKFSNPGKFTVTYDNKITSTENILSLEIFKTFEAKLE